MASRVTTVDQLVASVQHSFVSANALILGEQQHDATPDHVAAFTINNMSGKPPAEIPLTAFHVPLSYYLRDLKLELPCYTLSSPRLFKGRARRPVLYELAPTRWQRIYYRCCLYRLTIEIGIDCASTRFRAATTEEAAQQAMARPATRAKWQLTLTEAQVRQLDALPCTLAKSVYWPEGLMRFWRWLRGGKKQVA